MTAPPPHHARSAAPPPGCPAHAHTGAPAGTPAGPHADPYAAPYADDADDADSGPVRFYGPAAEADPMGLYEELRTRHGPVAPVLLDGDVPAWLVLGYRENLEVMRAPNRFSRDSRIWRDWREGRVSEDSPLLPMVSWRPDCISADGEEHQRLRTPVTESLERFDRRGVRRHTHRVANQLIDAFCADGGAELLVQYAQHVPMLVLTHLLGLPESEGPRLVAASSDLMTGTEQAGRANEYILGTLRDLVARKRADPGPDLASWLAAHPAGFTDEEVRHHLRLVLVAANATTINLIANTLQVVLTDRRFRASLAGVRMTVADAVEQVLWNEPPLTACPGGWAVDDTELGGQHIRAGDMVLLGLAAGNVDSSVRPDPAAPVRGNRSHLAFSSGPHMCPGQDIGRAITDAAVDCLLVRLPDVRLAVGESQLTWHSSIWARHLAALPVVYAPRRPEPDPALAPPTRIAPPPEAADEAAAEGTDEDTAGEDTAEGTPLRPAGGPVPVAAGPGEPSWWQLTTRWFFGR
ncbi:cytochrome P450 [Streptomyces sp. NPDC092296]|uniref:cytochrome P450 n=1 Tax=Streptomyces sp. NPDC092296 TaxID=3366012 RepID=UPI00381741C9